MGLKQTGEPAGVPREVPLRTTVTSGGGQANDASRSRRFDDPGTVERWWNCSFSRRVSATSRAR